MYAILLGNIPIIFITFICGPRATRNGNFGPPFKNLALDKDVGPRNVYILKGVTHDFAKGFL
jgi:hypothetical protein